MTLYNSYKCDAAIDENHKLAHSKYMNIKS